MTLKDFWNNLAHATDIDVVIDGVKVNKILRSPTAKDLDTIMKMHGYREILYVQPVDHRTIEVGIENFCRHAWGIYMVFDFRETYQCSRCGQKISVKRGGDPYEQQF